MARQAGWAAYAAVWVAIAVMGGCASYPTENHKTLNDLNYDAGRQLSTHPDPAVARTGADVRDNSDVLARTFLGWPENRAKYDAILSAKVRAETLKEAEENQPWYKKFFGWVCTGGAALLLSAIALARYFPATAAIANIIEPVAKSIFTIKQKAEAHPDDVLSLDDITAEISTLAKDPKAGPVVAKLLEKLHVQALVHAPEAPDLPAPEPVAAAS